MAEVAPAPATTAAGPTKPTKKRNTSTSKPRKATLSVSELIVKAVGESKERGGVSLAAIKKALASKGYDVEKNTARVRTALKNLVAKGILEHTKGTGASGSFKLAKKTAEPKDAKKSTSKPASNRASKPASSSGSKPASKLASKQTRPGGKKTTATGKPKPSKKSTTGTKSSNKGQKSTAGKKATKTSQKPQAKSTGNKPPAKRSSKPNPRKGPSKK